MDRVFCRHSRQASSRRSNEPMTSHPHLFVPAVSTHLSSWVYLLVKIKTKKITNRRPDIHAISCLRTSASLEARLDSSHSSTSASFAARTFHDRLCMHILFSPPADCSRSVTDTLTHVRTAHLRRITSDELIINSLINLPPSVHTMACRRSCVLTLILCQTQFPKYS